MYSEAYCVQQVIKETASCKLALALLLHLLTSFCFSDRSAYGHVIIPTHKGSAHTTIDGTKL